jgi:GAF domain-containing protein
MDPSQPPAPVTEMEQLFERLRSGLGAEWVALEPDDAVLGAGDDPRLLRSSVPLADGRPGVLMAQRGNDAPVFSDAERELFIHLAGLTETVLRVAGEASQRSRRLAVAQAVAAGVADGVTVVEVLGATVDAVFDNSGYYAVTATLLDHEADEQLIVADRTRALRNHTGMRRPLAAGLVGAVALTGVQQLHGHAGRHPGFEWPEADAVYNSLLLTPVIVEGRCDAVLELCDTRVNAFDPHDAELMASVAGMLASALMRAGALEESRHRAARRAVGSAVAAALTDAQSPAEALKSAASTVFANSSYDLVAATIVLEDTQEQLLVSDLSRLGAEPGSQRRPLHAGVVGASIQSREQILLGDAQTDPRFDWPHPLPLNSLLVTPVVVDDRCVAALEIWDAHPDRFDRFDAALMQHVSDHLAAAWRSINLRDESERRARRLELTLEVTRGVAAATSPEGALAAAAAALARSTAYETMAAVLADRVTGEQILVAAYYPDGELPAGLRRPLGDGITGFALEHGSPLRIDDVTERSNWQAWAWEPTYRSALLMPVVVDGTCVATLELGDHRPNRFSDQDMVLMATAAEQVAASLRRIGLGRESSRRADRLALAAELARGIAEAATVEQALDLAARTVFERVNYTATVATLALHEAGEQLFVSDYNADGSSLAGVRRGLMEGVIGDVILHCEPVLLARASEHPSYSWPNDVNDDVWESMVAVPVMDGGRCRAVMSVHEYEPDRLDGDDLRLMVAVAGQVAASLRGLELRHQSERRARRLALTAEIAKRTASAASEDEALRAAATTLFEAIEYGAVSVYRCHHQAGEAVLMVNLERAESASPETRWPIGHGITGRTIRTGQVVRLGRATDDPDYGWEGEGDYPSLVQAPVMVDGRCEAVLELAEDVPDRYTQDDEVLMRTAAEQVAAAMRGARLRSEAEANVRRLELTLAAARAVAAADSQDAVLETFVRTVHEGAGYATVEATIALPATGEQLVVASVMPGGESSAGRRRELARGTTGLAFTEGRQVYACDTADGSIPGLLQPDTWRSRLATPVVINDQVVAVLSVAEMAPNSYTAADELFMQTVAEQVAAALLGAQLRDESAKRASRLEVTVAVAEAVAGATGVEPTLRAAANTISRLVACGAVTAYVAEPETGEQVALVDVDLHDGSVEGMRRPLYAHTTGQVFAEGRQVRINHISEDPGFLPWMPTVSKYASVLITPITIDGQTSALIALYDLSPGRFDQQDSLLMQAVAEQIAAALRGAHMQSELRQRADRLGLLEQRHRALLERLVLAQEEERSRVAADLHDDTVQVLSACVIALDRVRRAIEQEDVSRAATVLDDVAELMAGAVDRTRRMTFELRPAVLWQNGLEAALRQLLSTVQSESEMQVSFEALGVVERLDETLETIAFRSIAELTTNARNHSRATRLSITLATESGLLHAVVSDDGRGFDLAQALSRARVTNHLGLEAMMERIDAAGGSITIETGAGLGTTARLSLPVRPAT